MHCFSVAFQFHGKHLEMPLVLQVCWVAQGPLQVTSWWDTEALGLSNNLYLYLQGFHLYQLVSRSPRHLVFSLAPTRSSRSNGGLVRCPVCLQVGGQRNWQCIWMCSISSPRILGWTLHMFLWTYHRTNCWQLNAIRFRMKKGSPPFGFGCYRRQMMNWENASRTKWIGGGPCWDSSQRLYSFPTPKWKFLLRKIFPVQALAHANVHLCLPFVSWIQTASSNDQVLQLWV
jgi:hypothetical protein